MSVTSFIQLKYFTPFDIELVPDTVIKNVYEEAFPTEIYGAECLHHRVHCMQCLRIIKFRCDDQELEAGIRRELIKYHT